METKYVWLVLGSTGDYEDYCDWSVRAFLTKEGADRFCCKLKKWAEEHGATRKNDGIWSWRGPENPDDPEMQVSYTGVYYSVHQVELENPEEKTTG